MLCNAAKSRDHAMALWYYGVLCSAVQVTHSLLMLQVQVMNLRKKLLGPEHPHTLMSMGNLAITYSNQGKWNEAEQLELQVMNLRLRKKLLGPEHPDTLKSMENIAITYSNQG